MKRPNVVYKTKYQRLRGSKGNATPNPEDQSANQRATQRCTNCRNVGYKRNRCPELNLNSVN